MAIQAVLGDVFHQLVEAVDRDQRVRVVVLHLQFFGDVAKELDVIGAHHHRFERGRSWQLPELLHLEHRQRAQPEQQAQRHRELPRQTDGHRAPGVELPSECHPILDRCFYQRRALGDRNLKIGRAHV